MPEPHLRAADTDREAIARQLGDALSLGRLTPAEYEERMATLWAAKTYGDLAELTADLPAPATSWPTSTPPPGPAPARVTAPSSEAAPWAWTSAWASAWAGPWGGSCSSSRRAAKAGSVRAAWAAWLGTAVVVLTIWTASWIAGGRAGYFWPAWVIGPWGAVLIAESLKASQRRPDRPSVEA